MGKRYLLMRHGLYYRPHAQGYTGVKRHAGRYEKSDERPDYGVTAIHEDDAAEYAPSCWPETKIEDQNRKLARLEDQVAFWRTLATIGLPAIGLLLLMGLARLLEWLL